MHTYAFTHVRNVFTRAHARTSVSRRYMRSSSRSPRDTRIDASKYVTSNLAALHTPRPWHENRTVLHQAWYKARATGRYSQLCMKTLRYTTSTVHPSSHRVPGAHTQIQSHTYTQPEEARWLERLWGRRHAQAGQVTEQIRAYKLSSCFFKHNLRIQEGEGGRGWDAAYIFTREKVVTLRAYCRFKPSRSRLNIFVQCHVRTACVHVATQTLNCRLWCESASLE